MSLSKHDNNILMGGDVDYQIDFGLGELILLLLKSHGEKVLQINAETGEELSAGLAVNKAITVAKWMLKVGIKVGDVVSVCSENRLDFLIVPFACFMVGAAFSPFNCEYEKEEIKHVINLVEPKICFCSSKTLKRLQDLLPTHKFIEKLVAFDPISKNNEKLVSYQDIIQGVKGEPIDEEFQAVDFDPADTVATILFSSGTTGLPKGVMTTHKNMTSFLEIARSRLDELIANNTGTIVAFGVAPFFHSMGFMAAFLNAIAGNLMIVLPKFKIKTFLQSIEKYKVSHLSVPPPLILLLLKHPLVKQYDLSSLVDIRSGAASLGKEMEQELKEKFKLKHASQGYGLTETTFGVFMNRYQGTKPGSVGELVDGMECKVIDENGNALGPNEEGEVCLRGPLIMKGYYRNKKATDEIIDKEGWLHTGDSAYYDDDGYFYIVDRLKELIKYNGFQVAPAELEALLLTHPSILDSAVIGLPDTLAGELPLAFVVRKPGSKVTEKQVQDFIAGKVSRHKKLRGGVRFIEEIPKNPSGKILRRVLRDKLKQTNKSKL